MTFHKQAILNHLIGFVVTAALLTWTLRPPAYAAGAPTFDGRSLRDVCGQLRKISRKNATAYLVNPAGVITEGAINLGEVNLSDKKYQDEGYLIPTRYRVVISAEGFVYGSTQDLLVRPLKPVCSGTSEFELTFHLAAHTHTPGTINEGLLFGTDQFYDSRAYYPVPPKYKFNLSLTGNLLSPKPELVETSTLHKEIDALLVGTSRTLSLSLNNAGNAPLAISDLVDLATLSARKVPYATIRKARDECAGNSSEAAEVCTLQIQKKRDDCTGRSLAPNERCTIELEKVSESPLPKRAVYVLNIRSNYRLGFNPRIEFKVNDQREVVGGLELK